MTETESLKLTVYFGERDRTDLSNRVGTGSAVSAWRSSAHTRFLADALIDLYEEHRFATSILLRGAEGFGAKHHLHTDRLLTLSEDLPLVSVAVDTRERIMAALPQVRALTTHGLITLERARLLTGRVEAIERPPELQEAAKLTVYCGRKERIGGRPASLAVVDLLRRYGAAGATVLLGVDGTVHGARARARFFGRNADVPLMIISIADGATIARILPELTAMLAQPLLTLERVRVCKRDGVRLAEPRFFPETDASGLPMWQKLMVYTGEQSRYYAGPRHQKGRPLAIELIHRLRLAGAAGATAVRGIWGYHGDHIPHGDTLFSLRRRVPIVTVIVDTPERIRRWYAIVDELTSDTGLVTSEMVPGMHA